jgi:hypothetical protein
LVAEERVEILMWALVAQRIVEFALAIAAAIKSVAAAVTQWRAASLGWLAGQAASQAAHDEAARAADERMQAVAGKPAAREEVIRRLEEGSA